MAKKLGLYNSAVQWIMERVNPYLDKVTSDFVDRSVEEHARNPAKSQQDNDRAERILSFEIKRRQGPGTTQDVVEALLAAAVKIFYSIPVAIAGELLKKKPGETVNPTKLFTRATAFTIAANGLFDMWRTVPRFIAGLQGSEYAGLKRIESIEKTGVDPFSQQQKREITKLGDITLEKEFSQVAETSLQAPDAMLASELEQIRKKYNLSPTSLMDRSLVKNEVKAGIS